MQSEQQQQKNKKKRALEKVRCVNNNNMCIKSREIEER